MPSFIPHTYCATYLIHLTLKIQKLGRGVGRGSHGNLFEIWLKVASVTPFILAFTVV